MVESKRFDDGHNEIIPYRGRSERKLETLTTSIPTLLFENGSFAQTCEAISAATIS